MLRQSLLQPSTRRFLQPSSSHLLRRTLAPCATTITALSPIPPPHRQSPLQKRSATTTNSTTTTTSPTNLLATQRLHRPISPHLSIYRPQITWYLSMFNRITGAALSGGLYIFATAYLVSPLLGWHLESAHMAEAFGSLGPVTKGVIKFGVALPFVFHSLNGVRHLVWDSGRELKNQQVNYTGWVVVAGTVLGAGGLSLMW